MLSFPNGDKIYKMYMQDLNTKSCKLMEIHNDNINEEFLVEAENLKLCLRT